ncbi:hypothetical protein NADFUDRAFT_28763 [Nadsonia fulvescens var. elongata DSM 6958]|uniref:Glycosyltransferase family 24 protein n=1 Tax=Nadsonia fulvescens var. elongata DSM 6958 TaxID=857566 RepID=A0A1E3PFF7_9ASCO|nr:hypothetical protein NADFUDRAFT_28763 [Nadsonia fulvescens var. elongata DSM 6958]
MKDQPIFFLSFILIIFSGISLTLANESSIPINVDLKANWNDVPFELEVIEAISAENNSAYYPLLDYLVELIESEEEELTDKEIYDALVGMAIQDGFISDFQEGFINYDLGLRSKSAFVQAYYQYYEYSVLPHFKEFLAVNCESWFWYNSEAYCNSDDVFALKTATKNSRSPEIFSFDHILGDNNNAPLVVLYADIKSRTFPVFHRHLKSSAQANKIRYIIRYKPSSSNGIESKLVSLSGYGVELAMKKNDYIVIDDRNAKTLTKEKEKNTDEIHKMDSVSISDSKIPINILEISKRDLRMMGLKAATFITQQSDQFGALKEISLNFPKYANMISGVPLNANISEECRFNAEAGLVNGENAIYVNNAPLKVTAEDDIFGFQRLLNTERTHVQKMVNLGISTSDAVSLITSDIFSNVSSISSKRYDYRSKSLIWLNNLELDSSYSHWSSDVNNFLIPNHNGQLHEIRNNFYTLVFAIDFSNYDHLSMTIRQLINLLQKRSPVQIAIIPLIDNGNTESLKVAQYAMYLYYYTQPRLALEFVGRVSTGATPDDAFSMLAEREPVLKNTKSSAVLSDEYSNNLIEEARQWASRLDVRPNHPIVIINGVVVTLTRNWLHSAAAQFEDDLNLVKRSLIKRSVRGQTSLKDILIKGARQVRNTLVYPTDMLSQKFIDIESLYINLRSTNRTLTLKTSSKNDEPPFTFWVIGNMNSESYLDQLLEITEFLLQHEGKTNIYVNFLHSAQTIIKKTQITKLLSIIYSEPDLFSLEELRVLLKSLTKIGDKTNSLRNSILEKFRGLNDYDLTVLNKRVDFTSIIYHQNSLSVIAASRLISPSEDNKTFLSSSDLKLLYEKEYSERFLPIYKSFVSYNLNLETYENPGSFFDIFVSTLSLSFFSPLVSFLPASEKPRTTLINKLHSESVGIIIAEPPSPLLKIVATVDPLSERGQRYIELISSLAGISRLSIKIILNPMPGLKELPLKRFYRGGYQTTVQFEKESGKLARNIVTFDDIPHDSLLTLGLDVPSNWVTMPFNSINDLDNLILENVSVSDSNQGKLGVNATYILKYLLIEGQARDLTNHTPPRGLGLQLGTASVPRESDTSVMATLGYFQLKANPGVWSLSLLDGPSKNIYDLKSLGIYGYSDISESNNKITITGLSEVKIYPKFLRHPEMDKEEISAKSASSSKRKIWKHLFGFEKKKSQEEADINIFTVASGHLYERFLSIMTLSVMRHTNHTVKFWLIEDFLSPSFKGFLPHLAEEYGFKYELITYKWPHWLRRQSEKQREIWGYKILFLDVLFPQSLEKVIFVDADQIVRTDLKELVDIDLHGAPYGYTPMCDSRKEIEGFRFWKQGYWKKFLQGKPYHISALYVIDLKKFRELGAGDKLRQHYQALSADSESLSNLDQDLPNHLQNEIPIFSLPQEWLWCETWCSDESLANAKTIDLCNNPMTKERKLDRARRQVPEWSEYDNEIIRLSENVRLEKVKSCRSNALDKITKPAIITHGNNLEYGENENNYSNDDNDNSYLIHDEL